jgi:hypothetical protein
MENNTLTDKEIDLEYEELLAKWKGPWGDKIKKIHRGKVLAKAIETKDVALAMHWVTITKKAAKENYDKTVKRLNTDISNTKPKPKERVNKYDTGEDF